MIAGKGSVWPAASPTVRKALASALLSALRTSLEVIAIQGIGRFQRFFKPRMKHGCGGQVSEYRRVGVSERRYAETPILRHNPQSVAQFSFSTWVFHPWLPS